MNRVVPLADMLPQAMALAQQVASRSSHAVARLKRVLTAQGRADSPLAKALELEKQAAMACFANADTAQRVHEFARKRLAG